MQLIAFLGRKRSGKNTAEEIVSKHVKKNDNTTIDMSFAGPMKDALADLLEVDPKHFYDQDFKEEQLFDTGYTPRELMQWYGNMMREKFGADFWLNKVNKKITTCCTDFVIITDLRFVEETKMVDSLGGYIIYLDREEILGPLPYDTDVSERVVYDSQRWAKEHATNYIEIDNNTNEINSLIKEIETKILPNI